MNLANGSFPFVHCFIPSAGLQNQPPILCLQGIDRKECDPLSIGLTIAPGAPLLSLCGQDRDGSASCSPPRPPDGVFEETDLRRRANDLAVFVAEARARYRLAQPIALGFSSGATVAAALLLLHPNLLAGAILIHPVQSLTQLSQQTLFGTPVLLLSGAADTIASPAVATALALTLRDQGAMTTEKVVDGGHDLSVSDLSLAYGWMRQNICFNAGL